MADSADSWVLCPICLQRIKWDDDLPLYAYDAESQTHSRFTIPADAGPEQRARMRRLARIRCPNEAAEEHFLPVAYGASGRPLVLGLVGARGAGKSHLLAAIVRALERGDLNRRYGVDCWPLDVLLHQRFLSDSVDPLVGGTGLGPTPTGLVTFANAFVVGREDGGRTPAALFDVAGDDLARVADATAFLDAADGLAFVVDPARLTGDDSRDPTFGTVLELLRASERLEKVSAAVVLAKADLLRFEDPVAVWLRRATTALDPAASLDESADVYAYLHSRGGHAWTRPYRECGRATLHVASATGGSADGLGVRPQRVLEPLVALLAMTGALDVPRAKAIGV